MNGTEKPAMFLRQKQVSARTGLARSTIYFRISEGSFPKAIPLGVRSVAWLESDVDNWIRERVEKARGRIVPTRLDQK